MREKKDRGKVSIIVVLVLLFGAVPFWGGCAEKGETSTPTPLPEEKAEFTPVPTETSEPVPTPTPTLRAPTPEASPTPTTEKQAPGGSPTPAPIPTLVPTQIPAPSPTPAPTPTPTLTPTQPNPTPSEPPSHLLTAASLADEGNYFKVVLDFTIGKSPYEIMQEYGQVLSDELPGIQGGIDQFLYDLIDDGMTLYIEILGIDIPAGFGAQLGSFAIDLIFEVLNQRVEAILPQLPQEYVAELDGLASTLTNTNTNKIGDGLLSRDELFFYNIFADVGRVYQCSAIGVFGSLSETGSTIVGRNFDLGANLEEYGSVTEIRKGDQSNSVYLIGWLANLNAYTAFNEAGIFGSIVDTTGSGEPYSSDGIYSYVFDLRYALEKEATLEGVADYMSQHPYAFNHLIFLADEDKSQILENNISGTGSNMRRALRSSDSELNPGITWDFDNAIVAVSAFMLKGNHDNFTETMIATARLNSYETLLNEAKGDGTVSWNEIKNIQSYDGADGIPGDMEDGDLYNIGTRRVVLFEPETFKLEVFFSPTPTPPDAPISFDTIPISFSQERQP